MGVNSEILRIKNEVASAFDAIRAYGVTVPSDATVADLKTYIAQIGLLPFDAGLFTEARTETVDAGTFTDQ